MAHFFPGLSVAGIVLFAVFHILAAILYTGGNHWYPESSEYSFRYNYWCDLMQVRAINGQPNPGRFFGITSLLLLALSTGLFWVNVGRIELQSRPIRFTHFFTGLLAISFLLLMPLYHDIASKFSMAFALFGFFHLIVAFLKQNKWIQALVTFCVLVLLLGNYGIWHTEIGLHFLPLFQKITLFIGCGWMLVTSMKMIKKSK